MYNKQQLISLVLGVFASLISMGSWAAPPVKSCSELIGTCDYYLCRESVQHCGEDGYFLRFGYHYCSRFFKEVKPNVSEREQQWLERVGSCLQRKVDDIPLYQSCLRAEDEAITSHTECYVQTGFCAMPMSMRFRLFSIVYGELKDERMFSTFMSILKRCDLPQFKKQSAREAEELIP